MKEATRTKTHYHTSSSQPFHTLRAIFFVTLHAIDPQYTTNVESYKEKKRIAHASTKWMGKPLTTCTILADAL
eukprot:scaffold1119_cov120-Cylindrotheca_fusiformis.AAC.4